MSRVKITIPNTSVAENLSGFPMFVDLSSLGYRFWDNLINENGYDIRVRDINNTALDFDLVSCSKTLKRGTLFVKLNLNTSTDSEIYIDVGNPEDASVGDSFFTTKRNAVWSSYHRVFFGDPVLGYIDHSGNGSKAVTQGLVASFIPEAISPDVFSHQGFSYDGTYYYTVDTNYLRKYDSDWNLINSNSDPCGDIGGSVDHLGDPSIHNGILYVPSEQYISISSYNFMKISMFNTSDLSYISSVDVSAQGHEVSSLCIVPEESMVYVTSYADGSKLWKYNLSNLTYNSSLTLSSTVDRLQGIEYWKDSFWVTSDMDSGQAKVVLKIALDGTVGETVSYSPGGTTTGNLEGLGVIDANIGYIYSTGVGQGIIYRLEYNNTSSADGVFFSGIYDGTILSNYLRGDSVTRYTSWTMGGTATLSSNTTYSTFFSYSNNTVDSRVTVTYRQASNQIGVWDANNLWLYSAVTPEVGVTYRMNLRWENTSGRYLFTNGVKASDTSVTVMPPSDANAIFIGLPHSTATTQLIHGTVGFVYLTNSLLSDNWILAESNNLNDPLSFYSVEEVISGKGISVSEDFKDISDSYVCIDNSWKKAVETHVIVNGVWKQEPVLDTIPSLTVPVTNHLKVYLDANEGITKDGSNLVSNWSDQSGSGNHFLESNATYQPLWVGSSSFNGRPAIRFNSSRLGCVQNNLFRDIGDAQIFYATRFNNNNSTQMLFIAYTSLGNYRFAIEIVTANNFYMGGRRLDSDTYDSNTFASYTMSTSTNYLYEIKTSYSNQEVSFKDNYMISELSSPMYLSSGNTSDTDSTGIYIGNRVTYDYPIFADVAEVLIYDRKLTEYESNQVTKYLTYKYF